MEYGSQVIATSSLFLFIFLGSNRLAYKSPIHVCSSIFQIAQEFLGLKNMYDFSPIFLHAVTAFLDERSLWPRFFFPWSALWLVLISLCANFCLCMYASGVWCLGPSCKLCSDKKNQSLLQFPSVESLLSSCWVLLKSTSFASTFTSDSV